VLQDLIACGMANLDTKVSLGLAAGKVYQGQSGQIREFMEKKRWLFWSPEPIWGNLAKRSVQIGRLDADQVRNLTARIEIRVLNFKFAE